MAIRKAKIGDTIYDVITVDEYRGHPSSYINSPAPIAVDGRDGILYPLRTNPTDMRCGFICGEDIPIVIFNPPKPSETSIYSDRNIIDFSQAGSIKDVIEAQARLADAERAILTTVDNEFVPPVSPNDTPEMSLLKKAITSKHIDLDKYESRFGSNYNNDKRLIKKESITFGKLRDICQNLDIRVTLVMEDESGDVPNPMGTKFEICLTSGSDQEEDTIETEGEES